MNTPAKTFAALGLVQPICRAVSEEGYETPTPIQAAAIPEILKGRDLLGCARTGTGKTAAFSLPILQRLSAEVPAKRGIRALILSPTRELALQISDNVKTYGRHLRLRSAVIFGGVGAEPQKRALRQGVDILVATPGRLLDLRNQGCVDFSQVEVLVLDEADRMLDMGFIHDIKRIIKALPPVRQNLLLSATMPKEVEGLIKELLKDPAKVSVDPVSSTKEEVSQKVYFVDRARKRDLLLHLLQTEDVVRALIFTRTKSNANRVAEFLEKSGIPADAIHGNKSQSARQKALENFRSGKKKVLVASDIAARGLDIDEISHVINFELTHEPETYVHRIGRTGRAGMTGTAVSFCDGEERAFLRGIERVTGKKVCVVEDHPFPAQHTEPAPSMVANAGRFGGGRFPPRRGSGPAQKRFRPKHKQRQPAKV